MNSFLNEMVNKGILSDKERFAEELKKHNLVINKEMVEAIGYDGETEFVSIDTEDMFVCCTCSRYCTSAYKGQCDKCNRCRCARCVRGDPRHPCVTEIEAGSSSESDLLQANTARSEMHFYEIDVNAHSTKPIGFTQQASVFYTMPCSFKKTAKN